FERTHTIKWQGTADCQLQIDESLLAYGTRANLFNSDDAWNTSSNGCDLGSRARRRDIRECIDCALAQPPASNTHQNCDGQSGHRIRPSQPEVNTDQPHQNGK